MDFVGHHHVRHANPLLAHRTIHAILNSHTSTNPMEQTEEKRGLTNENARQSLTYHTYHSRRLCGIMDDSTRSNDPILGGQLCDDLRHRDKDYQDSGHSRRYRRGPLANRESHNQIAS